MMWDCPKCATKVDDDFEICWSCGTSKSGVEDPGFVSADQAPPIVDPLYDPIALPDPLIKSAWTNAHGDPSDELVSCYQAQSIQEAKFLANLLIERGIPAMSDTTDLQDALGTLEGNPRVYCQASDYPRARAFVEEYDARPRD